MSTETYFWKLLAFCDIELIWNVYEIKLFRAVILCKSKLSVLPYQFTSSIMAIWWKIIIGVDFEPISEKSENAGGWGEQCYFFCT